MIRRIRIGAGSANFCPYNTPLNLLKHTRQTQRGYCLTLHFSPLWFRVHGSQFRVEYPGALSHLPARGSDQQTILHDETDWTDFLTRLGQEVLRSAGAMQSQAMIHQLKNGPTYTCRSANRADAQIKERTLSEPGELGRSPLPASARLNVADLGENGFGSFCRNKRTSAAGPNPIGVKLSHSFAPCGV